MKYKQDQAVLYQPLGIIGIIKKVNNRPEVADSQRNYLVLVNGYLVTVYEDQVDEFLAPAPAKPKPQAPNVVNTTGQRLPDVKTGGFKWPWKR